VSEISTGIPAAQYSGVSVADRAAIEALVAALAAAWAAGDGAAYARPFTEDCDYVTFNGERQRGRAAVAASHQALFDTHLRGSKLLFENLDMRPVGPDTLIVHSVGNSLLRAQTRPHRSRRSLQTLVAVRTPEGWRFTAFHNTRIFAITPFRALLMMLGL
jgi:uncharacterized protein (TIGR02246 family)